MLNNVDDMPNVQLPGGYLNLDTALIWLFYSSLLLLMGPGLISLVYLLFKDKMSSSTPSDKYDEVKKGFDDHLGKAA